MTGLWVVAAIAAVTAAAVIWIRRRPPAAGSATWAGRRTEMMAALAKIADADLTARGHELGWETLSPDRAVGYCSWCQCEVMITGEGEGAKADYGWFTVAGILRTCPHQPDGDHEPATLPAGGDR